MRERDVVYRDILAVARACLCEASLRSDGQRREALEAHIAGIPSLLRCRDERRHCHYLCVEWPRFVRACGHAVNPKFVPLWSELEAIAWPDGKTPETPPTPPLASYAGPIVLEYAGRAVCRE
jgi:hypothetical protein